MSNSRYCITCRARNPELKCSTFKHRDLKRGAALFYAFGIATVAFVQHYSLEPSANATTTSTVVSSSASAERKQ